MRAFLAAALFVAPALLFAPPAVGDACQFYEHYQVVVPNTNYYLAVDRSKCTSTSPMSTQHKETILVTRGDPSAPGYVVIAQVLILSARTGHAGGPGIVTDTVVVTSEQATVSATYSSTRTPGGFTTCTAATRVALSPSSSVGATTPTMSLCGPHDQMVV